MFTICVVQGEAVIMLQVTSNNKLVNMGFLRGTGHWNRFLIEQFVFLPSFIIPTISDPRLSCAVGSLLPFIELQYSGAYAHAIATAVRVYSFLSSRPLYSLHWLM